MSLKPRLTPRNTDEIKAAIAAVSKEKTHRLTVDVPESKYFDFKTKSDRDKRFGNMSAAINCFISKYLEGEL